VIWSPTRKFCCPFFSYHILSPDNVVGFKSIGKAGKAVTKQLGKTLTSIGESPDQRGHQKLLQAQTPQFASTTTKNVNTPHVKAFATDLGLDSGKS
jgi:hypothetical protein